MRRFIYAVTLGLSVALGTAACVSPTEPVALSAETIVVDVRSADEFATGHLIGAVNIDVQSSDFETLISELDPTSPYYVYCRSGNRSAQAIDRMSALGFTDLTNGGSVQSASRSSGLPVVGGQ